jgi:hypothetical protein
MFTLRGASGTDLEHPEVLCDDTLTKKLVSTNMYNYALFVIYVLSSMFLALLCVMGLWSVGVMDNHPLPLPPPVLVDIVRLK